MNLFEKSAPVVLRDAVTLLTAALVASAELPVDNDSYVTVETLVDLGTGGTNPTIELHPEVSMNGTDYAPAVSALNPGAVASGAVSVELADTTYTQTVAGRRTFHVPVYGAKKFRVRVRETGGPSPFGTCQITAVASRLGA